MKYCKSTLQRKLAEKFFFTFDYSSGSQRFLGQHSLSIIQVSKNCAHHDMMMRKYQQRIN